MRTLSAAPIVRFDSVGEVAYLVAMAFQSGFDPAINTFTPPDLPNRDIALLHNTSLCRKVCFVTP